MTWGAIGGAVVGGIMSDSGGGGQTATKEPWAEAAPWLKENLRLGQQLQGQYQANPFSATQQQAYMNQFGNSDYARTLASSVLGQMNGFQPFDRSNPTARPTMFQFPQMTAGAQGQPGGSMAATNPFMSAVLTPPPAPAPVVAPVYQRWQDDPRFASGYNPEFPNWANENAGPGNGS